jgi:hypothetical protein
VVHRGNRGVGHDVPIRISPCVRPICCEPVDSTHPDTQGDAADRKPGESYTAYIAGIADSSLNTMRELWTGKDQAERMLSVLGKFQLALVCAGQDRISEGSEPFQSTDLLVDLRNTLVHFKPQIHWTDDDLKFVRRLKSVIRPETENNQSIGQPWFPNRVLGAGCADWACESAVDFARFWHDRIGLLYDFDELYLTSLPAVEVGEI